jgi:hypothetical protein
MRRNLWTLALAGLFGSLLLASDAGACCHKKKCAEPCAAPAPEPCPPAPKCGHKFKLFGHKHKKAVCCPAPVVCATPVEYAPAVMPSGQFPSGQAPSGQAGY